MKYRVILVPSEDGFAVSCPALPGCWSQGRDEAEAIENIRTAIGEYLEVQAELLEKEARASGSMSLLREVDVATV
jgi:predicted RNase H-like HicB family nuclease